MRIAAIGAAKARRDHRAEQWPPVDAVVTWVDTTDPFWRRDFAQLTGHAFVEGQRWSPVSAGPEAELSTCLALLRLHLPWLRRIYVLTRSPQIPDCLAPDEIVVHLKTKRSFYRVLIGHLMRNMCLTER